MDHNDILIRPVLSEKSTEMAAIGKYVFRVPMKANKLMVARAVKEVFNVEPERVNVMVVRGRLKRVRQQYGMTPAWKKAIVTLKKGDKIELFEGQ